MKLMHVLRTKDEHESYGVEFFKYVQLRGLEKEHLLKSLGVDHVVESTRNNIILNVREYLKSINLKGVDVLYDHLGGRLLKDIFKLLN
jgi:NADPH2:quinone reductase